MLSSLLMSLLMAAPPGPDDATVAAFEALTYTAPGGDEGAAPVAYRLLRPEPLEEGKRYPLVLFLHGAGERGDDNRKQLLYLPELMARPGHRQAFPCFLLAPQCQAGKWWTGLPRRDAQADGGTPPKTTDQMQAVEAILAATLEREPIDRQRVYLTGLSMGGFASWDLATRHPEWFAAVVPICGGGNPQLASRLAGVPIWAFHGSDDPVVPAKLSREMIEALKAAGGQPRYTELEGVGHNSWTPAYEAEGGVLAWMFEQSRPAEP